MEKSQILMKVIQQLRSIFLEKHELKGYDDWNSFFGCINAIESVAAALDEEENGQQETDQEEIDAGE